MARRGDIKAKIRDEDPRMRAIADVVDKLIEKVRRKGGVVVMTTDDMTHEEKEMALFEGFLREGYTEKVAAKNAKEWLAHITQFAKDNERRRNARKRDPIKDGD